MRQQIRSARGNVNAGALDFRRRVTGPGPFLMCLGALPVLWLIAQLR